MIVVIEGGDQAGKKTQARMLARELGRRGISNATFSFPDYTTPIGREISMYLGGRRSFPPQAIHCLLAANRWEKLDKMLDAISRHEVVIMNRYYQSNLVYGTANGVKLDWLEGLDRGLPRANLVILLDIPRAESFARKAARRDRFETDGAFLQRVLATYRRMARKYRWKMVDASRPKRSVHQDIMELVSKRL